MLGAIKDLEDWEIELEKPEVSGIGTDGYYDDYPEPDLAAELVAIELNLAQWLKEGREELELSRRLMTESTLSGDHTNALSEALRTQYILGALETLCTLEDVMAYLIEGDPIEGPGFKQDAASKELLRQQAVRLVARLNDMVVARQVAKKERNILAS